MRGWQIEPAGVHQVLTSTGEHAEELVQSVTPARVEGIGGDLAGTGPVGLEVHAAIGHLLAAHAQQVAGVGRDAGGAITGVAAAVATYAQGQRDMATGTGLRASARVDLPAWSDGWGPA